MTTFKEAQRVRSKPVARSNVKQKFRPKVSKGEALLENHLNALKIPFTREFKFHPQRKWQADSELMTCLSWLKWRVVYSVMVVTQEVKATQKTVRSIQ